MNQRNIDRIIPCEVEILTDISQVENISKPNFNLRTDSSLPDDRFEPQHDDFDTRVGLTTESDPAILVEKGATICTLLFAIDRNGNAAIFMNLSCCLVATGLNTIEHKETTLLI